MCFIYMYDNLARYYEPAIGRANSIDPLCEKYYSISPYAWCGNNFVNIIDPNGMDWYESDDGSAIMWREGSEEIKGYKRIGSTYIIQINKYTTMTYEQNNLVSIEETVLEEEDWETQREYVYENGQIVGSDNKSGDAGNCFVQAGKMVSHSGATSLKGTDNDITALSEQIDYMDSQFLDGHSVRVHVDYNGDNQGDHWVAIASRITNLKTQSVSYRFFDPGTIHKNKGIHKDNIFMISKGALKGISNYRITQKQPFYKVTAIRKNK